ncbi:MAG: hypothetical protein ACLP9L_39100 [Thermoguttaceae bacterium]
MQLISGSVGEGGANATSDVALVQAILVKTQRAATPKTPAGPYLASCDGDCGRHTKDAIRAFQFDHVFVSPDGSQSMNNPMATAGLVAPNDATWRKLLDKVPANFADLRVLSGGKTVYIAATAAQLNSSIAAIGSLTFAPPFRPKIIACIKRVHSLHGIAIGVCPKGDRRDFQTQYELLTGGTGVTHAGPGESNHNFGMAVDLGFKGLRWLRKNGAVVEDETPWLHKLNPNQNVIGPEALRFWEALRSVGISVGLFRGPVGDRPHLQNWSDAGVDMATRLADLLVRSGNMLWSGAHQHYRCDLGFGGPQFNVGKAAQIWSRQATVTIQMLAQARELAATHAPQSGASLVSSLPAPPAAVTQADVTTMQNELRRQFELADRNWQNWTAH